MVRTLFMHYQETKYGFEWGSAKMERCFSDKKKGWVTFLLKTPKDELQIYVTKTGKVRIHGKRGELLCPNAQAEPARSNNDERNT